MDKKELEQSVKQEHVKYSEYLDKILDAFNHKCHSTFESFKTRHDRAMLAEDKEHSQEIIEEFKNEINKILSELKQNLELHDKRFLRHIEKFVSRIEQAETLKELEDQLNKI